MFLQVLKVRAFYPVACVRGASFLRSACPVHLVLPLIDELGEGTHLFEGMTGDFALATLRRRRASRLAVHSLLSLSLASWCAGLLRWALLVRSIIACTISAGVKHKTSRTLVCH